MRKRRKIFMARNHSKSYNRVESINVTALIQIWAAIGNHCKTTPIKWDILHLWILRLMAFHGWMKYCSVLIFLSSLSIIIIIVVVINIFNMVWKQDAFSRKSKHMMSCRWPKRSNAFLTKETTRSCWIKSLRSKLGSQKDHQSKLGIFVLPSTLSKIKEIMSNVMMASVKWWALTDESLGRKS